MPILLVHGFHRLSDWSGPKCHLRSHFDARRHPWHSVCQFYEAFDDDRRFSSEKIVIVPSSSWRRENYWKEMLWRGPHSRSPPNDVKSKKPTQWESNRCLCGQTPPQSVPLKILFLMILKNPETIIAKKYPYLSTTPPLPHIAPKFNLRQALSHWDLLGRGV